MKILLFSIFPWKTSLTIFLILFQFICSPFPNQGFSCVGISFSVFSFRCHLLENSANVSTVYNAACSVLSPKKLFWQSAFKNIPIKSSQSVLKVISYEYVQITLPFLLYLLLPSERVFVKNVLVKNNFINQVNSLDICLVDTMHLWNH